MFDAFLFDFDGVLEIRSTSLSMLYIRCSRHTECKASSYPRAITRAGLGKRYTELVHLELHVSEEVMVSTYAHAFATLVRTRSPRQIRG